MPSFALHFGADVRRTTWTSLNYISDIESVASVFEANFFEPLGDRLTIGNYYPGQEGRLSIDDQVISRFIVDDVGTSIAGQRHELNIVARDKTSEIIDSSAVYKSGQWKKASLTKLAKDLCEGHGIEVEASSQAAAKAAKLFDQPAIEQGETVHEFLERHARMRGLMMRTTKTGALEFYVPGEDLAPISLDLGGNIVDLNYRQSRKNRYYSYRIRSQRQGTVSLTGSASAWTNATIEDNEIAQTARTLIIQANRGLSLEECQERIRWERNVRTARSTQMQVTVRGWGDEFYLWRVADLVQVNAPQIGVEGTLLISGRQFKIDENEGATTVLDLVRPGAYTSEPASTKRKTRKTKIRTTDVQTPFGPIQKVIE